MDLESGCGSRTSSHSSRALSGARELFPEREKLTCTCLNASFLCGSSTRAHDSSSEVDGRVPSSLSRCVLYGVPPKRWRMNPCRQTLARMLDDSKPHVGPWPLLSRLHEHTVSWCGFGVSCPEHVAPLPKVSNAPHSQFGKLLACAKSRAEDGEPELVAVSSPSRKNKCDFVRIQRVRRGIGRYALQVTYRTGAMCISSGLEQERRECGGRFGMEHRRRAEVSSAGSRSLAVSAEM